MDHHKHNRSFLSVLLDKARKGDEGQSMIYRILYSANYGDHEGPDGIYTPIPGGSLKGTHMADIFGFNGLKITR